MDFFQMKRNQMSGVRFLVVPARCECALQLFSGELNICESFRCELQDQFVASCELGLRVELR
eukprot:1516936-Alexandrium_andersonii.AAC.1